MFLFFAGVLGGALNSVAGGGSFIALPALLFAGINPVIANATSTLALWPGGVSSAIAYRREIELRGLRLMALAAVSFVGGMFGAMLLVRTSDTSFMRLLPWLMLAAAVTFTFGRRPETVETSSRDTSADEAQRGTIATEAQRRQRLRVWGRLRTGSDGRRRHVSEAADLRVSANAIWCSSRWHSSPSRSTAATSAAAWAS